MSKGFRIIKCVCGKSYAGSEHYYKTEYCTVCGRWLHWDKYSDVDVTYSQAEARIYSNGQGRDY